MQVFRFGLGVWVGVQLLWAVAAATSLDGTSSIKYQQAHYVFRDTDVARGFVRLNNGFTVLAGANMYMDTVVSVSGGFDLRDSGVMTLRGNLSLDSTVTLTRGGDIRGEITGEGNTIFLGGDLNLNASKYANVLHIKGNGAEDLRSGDLIIDGRGNTLNIGDRAQIFVDANVTLTLRNMTIRTGQKSLMNPPIRLSGPASKLALDNVMFDLGADFQFKQGQLFIHNEVVVTGTSAFVYQSPMPSFITSGATWSFEQGTTFSVAPATYTDIPYTAGYATSNNFIKFVDQTSALCLSGCSFQTTFTGVRLTKGQVQFDNRVVVNTMAGVDLDSLNPVSDVANIGTTYSPYYIAWSPDSRFVAVGATNGFLEVYKFNGVSSLSLVGTSVATTYGIRDIGWSADGKFILVGTNNQPTTSDGTIEVYSFNGVSSPVLVGSPVARNVQYAVSWSPDRRFLVTTDNGSTTYLNVYAFNGSSTPTQVAVSGTQLYKLAWSPDERFFAGTIWAGGLQVFRFSNGKTITAVGTSASTPGYPMSLRWSPDGRSIAVVGTNDLGVYRFDGATTPTLIGGTTVYVATNVYAVTWSPNGRYIAVGSRTSGNGSLRFFTYDPTSLPVVFGQEFVPGNMCNSLAWSPNGLFLAAGLNDTTLHIYRCNFANTSASQQSFTSSLVLGDSANGSAYNANVQINGGARVELTGKIKDDSA